MGFETHNLPNSITVHNGDCLEIMRGIPDNTFTSIVTDPPYGLALLGKKWDYQVPSVEMFEEMLRVTKPGGIILCFGGSRTFHRVAVNIEDAGWYIRDTLMWIYGSGFPKSANIALHIDKKLGHQGHRGAGFKMQKGQEHLKGVAGAAGQYVSSSQEGSPFNGYGTSFKPAHEPIIVAMKPTEGSFAENALKHGIAGINIDMGRVSSEPYLIKNTGKCDPIYSGGSVEYDKHTTSGRWPSNVILGHHDDCKKIKGSEKWQCHEECPCTIIDERSGLGSSGAVSGSALTYFGGADTGTINFEGYQDFGGASRFFYCSKPSKREKGLYNDHPTVKPNDLMEYLVGLVTMPGNTTHILDPFSGSGSTLLAAMRKGVRATGCELDSHYVNVIRKRLDPSFAFEEPEYEEVSVEEEEDIFDFFGGDSE